MLRATLYVPGRTQMETVGLYKNPWLCTTLRIRSPKQRFIRTFVSRQHCPVQRKGGGISKGGTLVHLFGSVPLAEHLYYQFVMIVPDNTKQALTIKREKYRKVRIKPAAKSSL